MGKPKAPPPKKPRKDFPMWPHQSGSWCAVIDGERRTFGGWAKDRTGQIAMRRYNAFMEARRGGGIDPQLADTVTLRDVVNGYLTRQKRRAEAVQLSWRDFRDALGALESFADTIGKNTRVISIRPNRFSAYRQVLLDRGLAPSTIKRHIAHIKGMFQWSYQHELIAAPPRYGMDFYAPASETESPDRSFSPVEVNKMLSVADLPLRAMIRLGIEAGFGNTDIAALRWDQVDLDARIVSLLRHKTNIKRRCAISTALVKDLREWRKIRDKRKLAIKEPELVFSTKQGHRFVREIPSNAANEPPRMIDSVAVAFDKLCRNKIHIKKAKDGRSFYSLRRTHRTWSDELRDHHAAALTMGHRFDSTAGLYVQRIEDVRLFAINDHVLAKLKRTGSHPDTQSSDAGAKVSKRAKRGASQRPQDPHDRSAKSSAARSRRS